MLSYICMSNKTSQMPNFQTIRHVVAIFSDLSSEIFFVENCFKQFTTCNHLCHLGTYNKLLIAEFRLVMARNEVN